MKIETHMMLAANGYLNPVELSDGRIACIMPLLYTAAIIVMREEHIDIGYDDRWCYHGILAAQNALTRWQQTTPLAVEPDGWHRHPLSGRRRTNGDPLLELIEF